MPRASILSGNVFDCLPTIARGSVDVVVTSPPYWQLRSYLPKDHPLKHLELGSEPTPAEFVRRQVEVFRLVRACMADHATCWLNIGDTYSQYNHNRKPSKSALENRRNGAHSDLPRGLMVPGMDAGNLCLIPQRLAIALQEDGWIIRSVIIWHKPSPMPASLSGWAWKRCRVKLKSTQNGKRSTEYTGNALGAVKHSGNDKSASLADWTDCPGCRKCSAAGGYVLRRGSWRPTSSWEPILMLAKSANYFSDGEPVKTPAAAATVSRDCYTRVLDDHDEQFAVRHDHETTCDGGANLRDVWTVSSEPLKEVRIDRLHRVAEGASYDGTTRITSPDCPVHGDQPAPAPKVECDGRSADESNCIERTCGHPVPLPHPALDTTEPRHAEDSAGCNKDDLPREAQTLAAIPRSKRSRKKGRDPQTSAQDISSSGTPPRTEHSTESPSLFETPQSSDENRTESDGSGAGRTPQTVAGTADRQDEPHVSVSESSSEDPPLKKCTCQYYRQKTEKINHYAAFPTALVRNCLLAGTSSRGYCRTCGRPWVRMIDETFVPTQDPANGKAGSKGLNNMDGRGEWPRGINDTKTIGWRPSCKCPAADPRPALVLDPFAGSGRTAITANRLGLDFIGCDLNPSYVDMARRLIVGDAPLFVTQES